MQNTTFVVSLILSFKKKIIKKFFPEVGVWNGTQLQWFIWSTLISSATMKHVRKPSATLPFYGWEFNWFVQLQSWKNVTKVCTQCNNSLWEQDRVGDGIAQNQSFRLQFTAINWVLNTCSWICASVICWIGALEFAPASAKISPQCGIWIPLQRNGISGRVLPPDSAV